MMLQEIKPKANGTIRAFVIPFDAFIPLFTVVGNQIGRPHSSPSLGP